MPLLCHRIKSERTLSKWNEGKKNAGGAASVKARVAPLVPPTQEEDSQKKVKEDLEKHLELTQQKDDHVDGDHLMLPRGDDNAIASPVKPMKVNTDDDDWGMFEKKVLSNFCIDVRMTGI